MAVQKTSQDLANLVDLFLSPEFNPLDPREDSEVDLSKFTFEAEFEEDDTVEAEPHEHIKHNEYFQKKCGRTLAKMGDDFFKSHTKKQKPGAWKNPIDSVKDVLLKTAEISQKPGTDPSKVKQEQEKAWSKFKGVIDNSITGTGVDDAYKQLGAFLLSIKGLSNLGGAVRMLARRFSLRYIEERQLDQTIQRMGGMDALMQRELD